MRNLFRFLNDIKHMNPYYILRALSLNSFMAPSSSEMKIFTNKFLTRYDIATPIIPYMF